MTGFVSLGALVAQNTAIALTMRLAVTSHSDFSPATAVCCDEALKLSFCVLMMLSFYLSKPTGPSETQPLCHEPKASFIGFFSFLRRELCVHGVQEYLKMAVPALLYTIQKNLLYVALSNLHAVVYQVMAQSKILTTALFSYLILGRYLRFNQVLALLVLIAGVVSVQISAWRNQDHGDDRSNSAADPILGIAAVQMASLTSGFSSVYFEYMLKKSDPSTTSDWALWVRNIQLASFAFPIALITAFMTDGSSIKQNGFFHGYLPITWVVIGLEASGGIFVALVTKYADSILKNFATALAIVVTATFCTFYMGFSITPLFTSGAAMVVCAIFLYAHQPVVPKILETPHPQGCSESGKA